MYKFGGNDGLCRDAAAVEHAHKSFHCGGAELFHLGVDGRDLRVGAVGEERVIVSDDSQLIWDPDLFFAGVFDGAYGKGVVACHYRVKFQTDAKELIHKLFGLVKVFGTLVNVFSADRDIVVSQSVLVSLHLVKAAVGVAGVEIQDVPFAGGDKPGDGVVHGLVVIAHGAVDAGEIQIAVDQHDGDLFGGFYEIVVILVDQLHKFRSCQDHGVHPLGEQKLKVDPLVLQGGAGAAQKGVVPVAAKLPL